MINNLFGIFEKPNSQVKKPNVISKQEDNSHEKFLTTKEKQARLVHSNLLDSLNKIQAYALHPNQIEALEEIIDALINHSFDPGCNRDLDWREKGSNKSESVMPVEIFNRSTLCNFIISEITDADGKYNGTPCSIAFWDGSGIKNADAARGVDDKPYADLAINKMARVAVDVFEKATTNYGGKNYSSRWGGDEFWGCLIGGAQADSTNFIKKILPAKLHSQTGVFMETVKQKDIKGNETEVKKLVRKPLGLKESPSEPAIHIIEVPEDPERNMLFLHFLKKGLILKPTDIDNIQHEIAYFPEVSTKDFLDTIYSNNFYPYGISTNPKKVEFIKALSPEHGELLEIALSQNFTLPTENGTLDIFETLLNYVEKTIFHQLLGRHVGTFTEMYENLLKHQPEWISTEDIRFIKELNESPSVSYVGADLTLKDASDKINQITSQNLGNVSNYQRGGTSFQTYKDGLHDKTIRSLSELKSIEVNRKSNIFNQLSNAGLIKPEYKEALLSKINSEESTKIPVGFAAYKIDYPLDRTNIEEVKISVKNALNKMFEISDLNWHLNLFRLIVEQIIKPSKEHTQFTELVTAFVTQKRGSQRMKDIEKHLKLVSHYAPDINEYTIKIRNLLQEIVDKTNETKPIEPQKIEHDDLSMFVSKVKPRISH